MVEKYEKNKVFYDKIKEVEGVDELRKELELPDLVQFKKDKQLETFRNFDFDLIHKKVTLLVKHMGRFEDMYFADLLKKCKVISNDLEFMRESEEGKDKD